jgi:hypothetical protein
LDDRLETLDQKPGVFSVNAWRNVTIIVWSGQADGDSVSRLKRVTKTTANLHRNGFSNIHLVASGLGLPTSDARTGFIELMKDYAQQLACIGVVVGGTGFGASALRSFVTGMRVVSPWSFDFRIGGTIQEIGNWLPTSHNARTSMAIDAPSLVRMLSQAQELHTVPTAV